MRVLVVTPIPTPYRDPFWECFAGLADVELTVVYCATGREDRPWEDDRGYSYRRLFPPGKNLTKRLGWGSACYWNPGIRTIVDEVAPDVALIGGYNHATMLEAVRLCRRRRIPWLLMSESHRTRSGAVGRVKDGMLARWLRSSAGALPTGTLASRRLERLGVPVARQTRLPNVPDLQRLDSESRRIQAQESQVRERLGVAEDRPIILFAGRMVTKKRPLLLIEAFAAAGVARHGLLVLAGDGPLREPAAVLAGQLSLTSRVKFTGFLQPAELRQWMSIADLFVMPSTETWGVAPIEALACGVPVLVSDEVGCHADILTSPFIGEALAADNAAALSTAFRRWIGHFPEREEVRSAWRPYFIENTYASLSQRLADGLRQCCGT